MGYIEEEFHNVYKKEYDPLTKFWEVNFYHSRSFKTRIGKFYQEKYADLFLQTIQQNSGFEL